MAIRSQTVHQHLPNRNRKKKMISVTRSDEEESRVEGIIGVIKFQFEKIYEFNTFAWDDDDRCCFAIVEAVFADAALQHAAIFRSSRLMSVMRSSKIGNVNTATRGRSLIIIRYFLYLWRMLRPRVPMMTAAGFSLSASLHIAFPASPSTILAFVLT